LDVWASEEGGEPKWLISGGRDKVVLVWDLSTPVSTKTTTIATGSHKKRVTGAQQPKIVQTILTHESLESVGLIPSTSADDRVVCWTGGEKGVVRLWDALKAVEIGRLDGDVGDGDVVEDVGEDEEEQRGVREVL
jgi:U3 small nucleolar RNA-associated protein 13